MKSIQWDSSWPKFLSQERRDDILSFWEERFGIAASSFHQYEMAASSRVTYLIRRSPWLNELSSLRITRAGIPFTRNTGIHRKPTTEAVQRFGHLATRNRFRLTWEDLVELAHSGEINHRLETDSGFVFLEDHSNALWGCGLFLAPDRLLCRLPKNITQELARHKTA